MKNLPLKISVSLIIDPSDHILFQDGKMNLNPATMDKFYIAEETFREKVITFIDDKIGKCNWHLQFMQEPNNTFIVDIYCDSESGAEIISETILQKLPEYCLIPIYRGKYSYFKIKQLSAVPGILY